MAASRCWWTVERPSGSKLAAFALFFPLSEWLNRSGWPENRKPRRRISPSRSSTKTSPRRCRGATSPMPRSCLPSLLLLSFCSLRERDSPGIDVRGWGVQMGSTQLTKESSVKPAINNCDRAPLRWIKRGESYVGWGPPCPKVPTHRYGPP